MLGPVRPSRALSRRSCTGRRVERSPDVRFAERTAAGAEGAAADQPKRGRRPEYGRHKGGRHDRGYQGGWLAHVFYCALLPEVSC